MWITNDKKNITEPIKTLSGLSFWYLYGNLDENMVPINKSPDGEDNDGDLDINDASRTSALFQTADNCFALFFPLMTSGEYALLSGYKFNLDQNMN